MRRELIKTKRKKGRKKPPGHSDPEPSILAQIATDPVGFIRELRAMVEESNNRKGMILVEAFEREYPDLYDWAVDLADLEPREAKIELIKRWPKLAIPAIAYPDHLKWIKFLQEQIKLRRESDDGRDRETTGGRAGNGVERDSGTLRTG